MFRKQTMCGIKTIEGHATSQGVALRYRALVNDNNDKTARTNTITAYNLESADLFRLKSTVMSNLPTVANSSGVRPPAISHRHQSIVSQSSMFLLGFSSTSNKGPKCCGGPLAQSAWMYAAAPLLPFFINTCAVELDILTFNLTNPGHNTRTLYRSHRIFRSLTEETPFRVLHKAMNS